MTKKSIILIMLFLVSFNIVHAKQTGYPSDWYCGDMHLHSKHSETESDVSIGTIVAQAASKKLDFFFVTEHSPTINHYYHCNTCYYKICRWSWCPSIPYPCNCGTRWEWNDVVSNCEQNTNPLCIAGVEEMNAYYIGISSLNMIGSRTSIEALTANSRKNHYLGLGAGCIDCGISASSYHGCGTNLDCITKWHILDTASAGGLGIIAHSGTWESWSLPEMSYVDAIEVWNGASNGQGSINDNAVSRMINYYNGRNTILQKVFTMTGSSDMCTRNIQGTNCGGLNALAEPRTCCIMGSVSKSNIFNAIRSGKCQANNGPLIELKINNARIGDYTNVQEGNANVLVEAYSAGFGDLMQMPVKIYYNGNLAQTFSFISSECTTASGTQKCSKNIQLNINYNNDQLQYVFARLDSNVPFAAPFGVTSIKRALTNPIWLNVTPPPPPAFCNETDNGRNPALRGTCVSLGYNTIDYCISDSQVMEYYCNDQKVCANEIINCGAGKRCYNGACMQTFVQQHSVD